MLDPCFVSRPSDIWQRFLRLSCLESRTGEWNGWASNAFDKCLTRYDNNLWKAMVAVFV